MIARKANSKGNIGRGLIKGGGERPANQVFGAARAVARLATIFVRVRRLKRLLVRRTILFVTDFIALLLFYLGW